MKISIQGQAGSYHDIVRRNYFEKDTAPFERNTFNEVFADVANGDSEYGIVAIENSLYGSIHEVYDLLLKHEVVISGEAYLRIHHCLLGVESSTLERIESVHSHPVALAQCEAYLDEYLPAADRFEEYDTAGAAAMVATGGDPTQAAIASKAAAELHGLQILAEGIETNPENYTRFIVLKKQNGIPDGADKTSIVFTTDHKPGALYRALGAFHDQDINLSKLESRPIIGKAWHYIFYADIESGLDDPSTKQALEKLRGLGCDATVLGSYHKAGKPDQA